jgi:hypothetical protein
MNDKSRKTITDYGLITNYENFTYVIDFITYVTGFITYVDELHHVRDRLHPRT